MDYQITVDINPSQVADELKAFMDPKHPVI